MIPPRLSRLLAFAALSLTALTLAACAASNERTWIRRGREPATVHEAGSPEAAPDDVSVR